MLPLPPALPDDVLAKREQLPLRVAPVTFTGSYVRLVPLDLDRDVEALHAVSNGQPASLGERSIGQYDPEELIWRWLFSGPFANAEELRATLRGQVEAPNGLCLCVLDKPTDRSVGVVNFMNNFPEHLKIELGSIWYSPLAQRTNANTEATYLMLCHVFDLGYRRVEWKCNALNERSRRAALRMGFKFEGVQEGHYIIKNRNRDTAWFRLLDHEWAQAKARLEGLLYG
jgi:RimJ/RimL family protein N-acetyltransferase